MFWEIDPTNLLTIAIRAPAVYAQRFPLPGDMMYQFLAAIHRHGIGLEDTQNIRVRFDKTQGTFLIRWSGYVTQNPELVFDVVPALTRQLGITSHGERSDGA